MIHKVIHLSEVFPQLGYNHCNPKLTIYLPDNMTEIGRHNQKHPCLLICPGGGYGMVSQREGEPIGFRFLTQGYNVFVLARYSIGERARNFEPLCQLAATMAHVRAHADEWRIQKDKIAVCGFSAGGHLALAGGIMAENKPDAMVLGYPAASAPNMPGMNFMLQLLEGKKEVTAEDAAKYDLVSHITKDAPPVFIAATAQDLLTPHGALPIAQKYSQFGTNYELHIFQYGPHGYALANEVTADGGMTYVVSRISGNILQIAEGGGHSH